MVALSGAGWVLAPSLVAYVKEADRYYPNRDRSSDGSIGDAAHASRGSGSDHNPDDGYVHAVDLDEDLAPGLDLKGFAERLRLRRDPRVKYVIYEGRMFSSYATVARKAWAWGPYTGTNGHFHHLHLSILHTDAARNNLDRWGFAPSVAPSQQEDDLDAKEHQWLEVTTKRVRLLEEKIDRLYDAFFAKASAEPSGNLAKRIDVTYEKVKQL